MFGRKTRQEREEEERQARQERHQRERAEYWSLRFDQAKNDHETTRVHIDYRNEILFEWLKDFDRRGAAEMRQHAKSLERLIWVVGTLLLLSFWWR